MRRAFACECELVVLETNPPAEAMIQLSPRANKSPALEMSTGRGEFFCSDAPRACRSRALGMIEKQIKNPIHANDDHGRSSISTCSAARPPRPRLLRRWACAASAAACSACCVAASGGRASRSSANGARGSRPRSRAGAASRRRGTRTRWVGALAVTRCARISSLDKRSMNGTNGTNGGFTYEW